VLFAALLWRLAVIRRTPVVRVDQPARASTLL